MVSSIVGPLLRRVARLPLSSLCGRHRPALTYFSLAPSPSSSYVVRSTLTQNLKNPLALLPLRFASSKVGADENLLHVLEKEIDCVQEFKDPRELEVPEGFPFEIMDNSGDQTITLKREFAGENIQALVYMNLDGEGDGEDDDKDDDTDEESTVQSSISLHVTIDKGDSPILEFSCNLNSDELEIESMARKSHDDSDNQGAYEGPDFSELDENLQKALVKYLEVRGINTSLHGFLYEYMSNKDEREYLTWLKNIKEFVRK